MKYSYIYLDRNIGWIIVAWEICPEYNAGDRWTIMSMRFNKWASKWIEENILPGANTDVETYEDRAKRLIGEMFAEAAEAKFKKFEMKEEEDRLAPLILAAVSDNRDFDYDVYKLKFLLAEELEDGD
jgi:hypothetical protein